MNDTPSQAIVSQAYNRPVFVAVVTQTLIGIACALTLDGGVIARHCGIAVAGFWCGAAVVMCRCPFDPQSSDLACLRYGFVPIFIAIELAIRLFPT